MFWTGDDVTQTWPHMKQTAELYERVSTVEACVEGTVNEGEAASCHVPYVISKRAWCS